RSIRFKAQAGTVLNLGASDIFEYTLPAQTAPVYIHVTAKLEPDQTYSALLNTFNCPVQPAINFRPERGTNRNAEALTIFPNPSDGLLFADCSAWTGQRVQLALLGAQGQVIQTLNLVAEASPQILELPLTIPNGLYFIALTTAGGERMVQRIVLQR
ncbi:MAG: T9SS type A sorting domain-containing protein, partial [Saprospiraceae bacterium]